jgi:hypothetical protein
MPEQDQPMVVGQGALCVADVGRAIAFYGVLGSRPVLRQNGLAVVELRGGTHLILFQASGEHRRGPVRSFGLLVQDALAFRAAMAERGIEVGPAWNEGTSRCGFEMTDPDGHVVSIVSGGHA